MLIAIVPLVLGRGALAEPGPEETPWRLGAALGTPSWLRLGLDHQARFEQLENDFRAKAEGDAMGLMFRTFATAEARGEHLFGGIELEDARAFITDQTPANTTLANPIEVLQAHVGIHAKDVVQPGDAFEARAGRITIDLGTRRLIARNRFRNTINGFTGVDVKWASPGQHVVRSFVAVPVSRLPSDDAAIRDNTLDLDEENTDAVVWAAAYGSPTLVAGTRFDAFVVGFHERDGELATRNRQLFTADVHWYRKPARGQVDFDVEVMPQVGRARATAAADDSGPLDHRAFSTHAEVGINPATSWKPRVALLHDYASGDRDPGDGALGRFDPLFGARRFDFGPTGIYGPFARSNLNTPGLRASASPMRSLDVTATYRLCWLASGRDAWTTANATDPAGESGTFLGEHVDLQVVWNVRPRNLALEAGAAYLRRGRFARTAPETRDAPASYLYTQLSLTI